MPYIEATKREACQFEQAVPQTPGELNFAITALVHRYIKAKGGVGYTVCNEAIGVLECAKLELYRAVLAPYEDRKREENGPVSELDVAQLPAPVTEITREGGVDVVISNLTRLLDERLPPRPTTGPLPPRSRKKAASAPQEGKEGQPGAAAPAAEQAPAEPPKTSTTRRPARSVGVSPMTGVAAPEGVTAAPAVETVKATEKPVVKPKLDPHSRHVSDVWSQAASGNGEDDEI